MNVENEAETPLVEQNESDGVATERSGTNMFSWVGLVVFPGLIFLVLLWLRLNMGEAVAVIPPPIISQAPDFTLVERSGDKVSRDDLLGKVWVADFVFTRCAGPCPELTLRMRSLQQSLRDRKEDVRLVSITLDPDYDSPGVLTRYAQRNKADKDQWLFLTGAKQSTIHDMIREGFLQSVVPEKDGEPIVHSTYFVLVDQQGQIRGFYDGLDPGTKKKLLRDIDLIFQEQPLG